MKKFVPLLIIFVSIILSCTGNIPNQSINNIKTFELKSNTCDGTYKVELYDIDDAMIVYVNDNFVTNHGYGRELTSTDISEYIKHGTNNVEFILFDYGANAYAYGVRLLKDDIILYEDHHLANGWGGTYGDPIPHIPYRYIHTFEANCPPTPTPTPTPDECDCNSTSFRIMASGPTCYDKCNETIFPKDNINNPCKSNTGNTAIVSVYDFDQNGPDLTFVLAPYNKFPIKNDNFKIDYNKALSNLQDSLQVEGASKTGQKDGLIKDEALFSTYPRTHYENGKIEPHNLNYPYENNGSGYNNYNFQVVRQGNNAGKIYIDLMDRGHNFTLVDGRSDIIVSSLDLDNLNNELENNPDPNASKDITLKLKIGDKEEIIKMNLSLDKTKTFPNGRFKWKIICK